MTDLDPLLARRPLPPPATRTAPQPAPTARASTRPRRRHPALGGRIVAAGIGVSTMLGLVASMGIASATADDGTTGAEPVTAPLADAPTAPPVVTVPNTTPATAADRSAPAPAPVTLTARPDVRVVAPPVVQSAAPAPAPVATTRGSR